MEGSASFELTTDTRRTGDILCSSLSLAGDDKIALLKSGPIRCAAVNRSGEYIATTGDDKILKVWSLEEFRLLSARYVRDLHLSDLVSLTVWAPGKCQREPLRSPSHRIPTRYLCLISLEMYLGESSLYYIASNVDRALQLPSSSHRECTKIAHATT